KGLIDWETSLSIPLYLRMFDPQHANLAFIGLLQPQGCLWKLTEVQAKLLSLLLTQQIQLPENWRSLALTEGSDWSKQFLTRPRHSLEVHYPAYLSQLQRIITGKILHDQ
ncbi:MAG TPA: monooxygenase, partial [Nitrosomonas sp.]|nr:monooxygenase [Nitrosomonas sp.]